MKKEKTDKITIEKAFCDKCKKPKRRYCSYCGTQMITILKGAENNMMFYGDVPSIPFAQPYNKITGKRNYCFNYICPEWKKKLWGLFYSQHDNYFVDEIINY